MSKYLGKIETARKQVFFGCRANFAHWIMEVYFSHLLLQRNSDRMKYVFDIEEFISTMFNIWQLSHCLRHINFIYKIK